MPKVRTGIERVGKAYRGEDGVVRWIVHLSKRRVYHVLWLSDQSGCWHRGASIRMADFNLGEEVPAPQPGESYRLVGPMGVSSTYTVPLDLETIK